MPKLKTSSSITKRFKSTGTQKLLRRQASKSHLLQKKTQSRKKKLSRVIPVYSGDLKGLSQKYFI
uniref:Large ribosomal subunit protein bL35c n=1 Tax=Helminthora furcellata TaxID=1884666 RepID=A0A1G4NR69_9FLOR|nr:Ribosomal protein L35 [Helminthora furcellata]SCW21160.1 Ribosomal protein L35 [Helminthora furcellata]SCW24020.1 Ribosomal protein L35 [Helminthora furcellata]